MADNCVREVEILLIEDNPADVELTLHALSSENLSNKIHVVRDGEEALDFVFARADYADRANSKPPRFIMLDLKLPKVDGIQVLRALKASDETKLIPVVVLTSSTEERDLIESYALGVNSYIQKPVDFDRFRETIRLLGMYWLIVNRPAPAPNNHSV